MSKQLRANSLSHFDTSSYTFLSKLLLFIQYIGCVTIINMVPIAGSCFVCIVTIEACGKAQLYNDRIMNYFGHRAGTQTFYEQRPVFIFIKKNTY